VCVEWSNPRSERGATPFTGQWDTTSAGRKKLKSVGLTQLGKHTTCISHFIRLPDVEGVQGGCMHDDGSTRGRRVGGRRPKSPLSILSLIYATVHLWHGTTCKMKGTIKRLVGVMTRRHWCRPVCWLSEMSELLIGCQMGQGCTWPFSSPEISPCFGGSLPIWAHGRYLAGRKEGGRKKGGASLCDLLGKHKWNEGNPYDLKDSRLTSSCDLVASRHQVAFQGDPSGVRHVFTSDPLSEGGKAKVPTSLVLGLELSCVPLVVVGCSFT
jgi:hypothetical protein